MFLALELTLLVYESAFPFLDFMKWEIFRLAGYKKCKSDLQPGIAPDGSYKDIVM